MFGQYISIANRYRFPIMLTTPTRRANQSNVEKSDYNEEILRDNVAFLREVSNKSGNEVYVGALMGCKGDAYQASEVLSTEEAMQFHSWQAQLFKKENVDFFYAGIMPALPEAIGMAKAMGATGIPYIISFMIRENGRLIDGTTIHEAMLAIEEATVNQPLCYMTNCVHPIILAKALSQDFNQTELVSNRLKGLQANASPLSPEELDRCCKQISSDPMDLADEMMKLHHQHPLKIFGGCCGTDHTHIEEIAKRLVNLR